MPIAMDPNAEEPTETPAETPAQKAASSGKLSRAEGSSRGGRVTQKTTNWVEQIVDREFFDTGRTDPSRI